MSDSAMYEALAHAALRIHGKDARKLRRAIAQFEQEREHAKTPECAAGFDHVLKRLRDHLAQLDLPLEPERGP